MANLTVGGILEYASKIGASDIHITEGKPLTFRINGKLVKKDDAGVIDQVKTKQILLELLNENKNSALEFLKNHDKDFAYVYTDGTSFRCNAYFKLGKISLVLRRIASGVTSMDDLDLPESAKEFTKMKQGLILVTGPTGSGKSTTMVSILEEINKSRGEHIITIEDPVEHVFKDDKSMFSQREIGRDTNGFKAALRSVMREDPDVIMIGEMRDQETARAALELAETGHLVISTLHTSSAVQTVTRLLSLFGIDEQNSIRNKIADNLRGVLSQRLIPTADRKGRHGIFEIMFVTTGIKNLIKEGDLKQIDGIIEVGKKYGMINMRTYADILESKGIIKEEDYIGYFRKDDD